MGLFSNTVSYKREDTGTDEAGAFVSALGQRESSGRYDVKGVVISNPKSMYYGDRAYGKYQVMGKNIPTWTKQYLGREYSKEEFLKDTMAQDQLMKARASELYKKFGSWADVASVHFTGQPLEKAANKMDDLGTVNQDYVDEILGNMSQYLSMSPTGAPFKKQTGNENIIESLALAIPRGFARFALSAGEALPRVASGVGELTGLSSGKLSKAVLPPERIPGLGFLGGVQSYMSEANAGEAGLGETALNVALDEPIGFAVKPVVIGVGFIAKMLRGGVFKTLAKESDALKVTDILTKKAGIPEELAKEIAPRIAAETNERNIQKIISEMTQGTKKAGLLSSPTGSRTRPRSSAPAPIEGGTRKTIQSSKPKPELPKNPASYSDDIGKLADEKVNVENFNISKEGRKIIEQTVEEVKPTIQKEIGRVLSNKEALKLADNSSRVLRRTVGRDKTLEWQAAMINARRSLAKASADGRVDKDYIENLLTVKTQGTDIARRLQSLSVGADPKDISSKQAIVDAVLKVTEDADKVAAAARGVDFNDFSQAAEFYRKFVKPTAGDWLDLIRYNSMLSSPKTHIINTFSNLLNTTLVAPVEKAIAGGLDFLGAKISGGARKQFAGEGGAYLFNYFKNLRQASFNMADVMRGKKGGTNLDTKHIPIATKGAKGALVKTLGFPMRVLEATDQFFTALAEGAEMGALKYRVSKGVKVRDIQAKATESAEYRLFRQELFNEGQGNVLDAIDQITSKIQGLRNNPNPIVSNLFKFTVPFIRTPMNILKQGLEYSPLGFSTIPGAKNKTEQLAKAILGTSVAAAAYSLIASNRLTWAEPTDPKLKQSFRAAGMQPYSVKIGETWYSFQKLPPAIAFPVAMVASIHDLLENRKIEDNTVDLVLSGIAKYGQFFADQSYVKSFGDLIAAAKGGESGIERVVSNYSQQLVPFRALGGWLARMNDAVQRKPDTAAPFVEQQIQLLMMNIPGLSQKAPARLDRDGNPIPNQRRVINAFSPIQSSAENEKVEEFEDMLELKKLNRETSSATKEFKERAEVEFEKISGFETSEEKKQYLKTIAKTDPELAKKIINLAKEKKTGRTAGEESLQNAPIATRVKFIMKELETLSTPEEKKALIKNYVQKKIVTEDVLLALAKAMKETN